MPRKIVGSWGNVIRAEHSLARLQSRHEGFPRIEGAETVLPYGNGRSYGDSCLNVGAGLVQTRGLDKFIEFDRNKGVLACEAGVLLADILQLVVPAGWFVPVSPGTCYVTVGGAIANDVHGKNHHGFGTFARHVRRMELLRSDGQRIMCSSSENAEWFAATAGGLGLTGIVTWAELQLRRVPGALMDVETIRFHHLDEFLALCADSDTRFEYTVAWVDCLGRGKRLGRGLFQRANHAPGQAQLQPRQLAVPCMPPFSLVNAASLRVFNTAYYYLPVKDRRQARIGYAPFFYPLDGILHWNRLYGPHGLYQYQCVIPGAAGPEATAHLLQAIARSGQGSFLAVLKMFGPLSSPGMLSFPQQGITLALDFPNRGERLERLFNELDAIVRQAGGRLYPAKDGRMPGSLFRSGFARWQEFSRYIDPRCSSTFWRRVMEDA
ncbi:MAG: FAD-dependent oxidoreductase [Steroidobacteraceae bacterium]